jgi:hypothetical protein
VIGVCENFIGEDEFGLVVARVDRLVVGARGGQQLAAIDSEGLGNDAAVAGEDVGAVLPLYYSRRTGWLSCCGEMLEWVYVRKSR